MRFVLFIHSFNQSIMRKPSGHKTLNQCSLGPTLNQHCLNVLCLLGKRVIYCGLITIINDFRLVNVKFALEIPSSTEGDLYIYRPYKDTCKLWSHKVKAGAETVVNGDDVCTNENSYTLLKCGGLCDRRDNACLPTRTKTVNVKMMCKSGMHSVVLVVVSVLLLVLVVVIVLVVVLVVIK